LLKDFLDLAAMPTGATIAAISMLELLQANLD